MRRSLVIAALSLLTLAGCHKTSRIPALALEECDPARFIPCLRQEAFASIPITDTGAYLTYSSRWLPGPQHVWDANGLGLGGWSLNFVQRYDKASRLLTSGDGSWRLVDSVSLPSGEQAVPSFDGRLAYIFDSAGHHLRTMDAHLGTALIKISYDGGGRLAKLDGFRNGQPIHVSVERDSSGRARSLVGTDGGTTALDLDQNGRLVSVTNAAGQQTHVAWNSAGRVESVTDPAGGVVRFTYDASGRLGAATDPDGVTQTFDYKTASNAFEVDVSTALGRHWSYRAESTREGIRRTFIARDGTTSAQTTDAQGTRVLQTADGTSYNIGAIANSVWGMAAPTLTPITQTRPDGVTSRREVKNALQPRRGLLYELEGSVTTTVNGQSWIQNYDPAQHAITLVDPAGRRTTTVYDEQGRIAHYSAPGLAPVSYLYNGDGRVASVTLGTGKLAYTTRYTYDANTGEIVTTRPNGTSVKLAMDRTGQAALAAAGDGSTVLTNYDAAGRLAQIQPPGGSAYTLGVSPAGRATGFAPPMVEGDASVETIAYDKDGELAAISGMGQRTINYEYDSGGRIIRSTFDQGKSTASFDVHSGLRTQAIDPSGVATHYGYAGSRLNRLAWSGPVNGSVSVRLDANGRATQEDLNGSDSLDFGFDAAGNLIGIGPLSLARDATSGLVTRMVLGAVATKQEFDERGRLTRSTTTVGGKVVFDQRYTRDSLGRIKAISESGTDGKTSTTEYSYDRADRLASVRVNGRVVETETYDPAGNRISVARPSGKLPARYDPRERLLHWGSTEYSWRPDGHLARRADGKGATSFAYDDFGALRGVTLSDGRAIKYFVDADGRRVGREADGKVVAEYLYRPNGSMAAELDASGKVLSRFGYDHVGHLALVERGGATYRVLTDEVGSPRLVVDSRNGTVADEISYDAWGNVTRDTAPGFIPIGFAGGLHDSDTGLIRFGARDYDPETGRWTAADPIRFAGGAANLYVYAGADPVNGVDQTGLFVPGLWFAPAIGGAVGLGYGAGTVYKWLTSSSSASPANPPTLPVVPLTPLQPTYNPPPDSGLEPLQPYNPSGQWVCSSSGTCDDPDDPSIFCTGGQCANGPSGWTCQGVTCAGPNGWGCIEGSCSEGPNGSFQCNGQSCFGPQGSLCSEQAGQQCSVSYNPPGSGPGGGGGNGGGGGGGSGGGGSGGGGGGNGGGGNGGGGNGGGGNGAGGNGSGGNGGGGSGGGGGGNGGAGGWGDTHLSTVDRVHFDLQAAGEFVAASAPNGGIMIQARQQQWGDSLGAINTAVAANVNGDRVGVYSKEPAFLMINDVPAKEMDMKRHLPHGGTLERHGGWVMITWPDLSRLKVTTQVFNGLDYEFMPGSKAGSIAGLLGSSSGDAANHLTARDGVVLNAADHDFQTEVYRQFANSWRIRKSESLFHYWPGESTAKFTDPTMPLKPVNTASLSSDSRSKAESICRAFGMRNQPFLDDCVLDVSVTGMPAFLVSSFAASLSGAPTPVRSASAAPAPPVSTRLATDQYEINLGDTVSLDHPSAGAGTIPKAGEKQFYLFSAAAGAIVYVKVGPCDGDTPNFDLHDPDDHSIELKIGCGDFGPVTLSRAGTYRIVTSTNQGGAHYSFSLLPTTLDQYSIKIGDTVSPDHPARGAGVITQMGEQQSYSFQARAGQIVYYSAERCEGVTLWFKLLDQANTVIDVTAGCGDRGPIRLRTAGVYRILVSADRGSARYGFQIAAQPISRR